MAPALADDRCYQVAAALEAAQDAARGAGCIDRLPAPAAGGAGVSGALKAAWALTAFVVVAGVGRWLITGRAVFAVFIVLGRADRGRCPGHRPRSERAASKEEPTP